MPSGRVDDVPRQPDAASPRAAARSATGLGASTSRDAEAVAARVADLLGEVDAARDPRARELAYELVRTLMRFYGAGLARIVTLVVADGAADEDGGGPGVGGGARAGRKADREIDAPGGAMGGGDGRRGAGAGVLRRLADDELVGGLLALHDLHPRDTESRVLGALETVRPTLGAHAGDVDLLAVEPAAGLVRLRLTGSCHGCPSSTRTVTDAIERAIQSAAPEVVRIEVDGLVAEPDGGGGGSHATAAATGTNGQGGPSGGAGPAGGGPAGGGPVRPDGRTVLPLSAVGAPS
jgi:Fe-S cluster biogenesis protein NfuA